MKKKGFTIIELIIVIGILGLAFPVLFSIFFAVMQQQARIYKMSEVKQQGDFILSQMERTIKNDAIAVYDSSNAQICDGVGTDSDPLTSFYFKDVRGNSFNYTLNLTSGVNIIASNSALPSTSITTPSKVYSLSTNRVTVTDFTLSCTSTSDSSSPLVSVLFTVSSYPASLTRPQENISMTYQTKLKLRSY